MEDSDEWQTTMSTREQYCMVDSRNCLTVGRMLDVRRGVNKKFFIFKDADLVEQVYQKWKEDNEALGEKHDIYFRDQVENDHYKALCCVFYCYKTVDQRARLVVTAGILKVL